MNQLKARPGRLTIGGVICNPDGTTKSPLCLQSEVPRSLRRRFILPCEIQHDTDARNVMADALTNLFDIGSVNTEGRIKIFTTGGITLLATVLMADPAFDPAVFGVAQGYDLPWRDLKASGSGTASEFIAIDRNEKAVLTGHVAVAGEDMSFPQTEIAVNDIVKLLSVSYTAPP